MVQLYLKNLDAIVPVAIHSLVGFKRIHLAPGEIKTVDFSLPPAAFYVYDDAGERQIQKGRYDLFVGGGQPGKGNVPACTDVISARISLH